MQGATGSRCKGQGKGSFGCSDHVIVESKIFREVRQAELETLVFRKVPFGLFRDLLIRNTWKTALEGKGNQRSSLIFKVNVSP